MSEPVDFLKEADIQQIREAALASPDNLTLRSDNEGTRLLGDADRDMLEVVATESEKLSALLGLILQARHSILFLIGEIEYRDQVIADLAQENTDSHHRVVSDFRDQVCADAEASFKNYEDGEVYRRILSKALLATMHRVTAERHNPTPPQRLRQENDRLRASCLALKAGLQEVVRGNKNAFTMARIAEKALKEADE